MSKNKAWLARNYVNVSEWSDMSILSYYFNNIRKKYIDDVTEKDQI
jgi:hypothetical protein